jgi:phosphoribosylaminoimidazolecarboxamide formyltransferase / IMP cyclohydrolase
MTINIVERIDDAVAVRHALVSVSDKTGLETFVPGLAEACPDIRFLSTGGTYGRLKEILGPAAGDRLTQVSDYTGQPETQGGLVKTLDFKIYLGLLTETHNEAHQGRSGADGRGSHRSGGGQSLSLSSKPMARPGRRRPEGARGNIDIGGPCMIRAAAKNFIRVTPRWWIPPITG